MEVFLYNSTVCRLCGEENDNGTFLYSAEENNQNISDQVNAYLPIKVCDDGQLPRTICPGCTIQLEATVEFINLIVNGQKVIRALHQRELEYKKTVLEETQTVSENYVSEVDMENGAYQPDHAISLQVAGVDKPRRKRGRPPKKHKTPEEVEQEAALKERELQQAKQERGDEEATGKRKRKTPTRFKEVVQGKELEKIFKEEGVTDGEESEPELKPDVELPSPEPALKVPEVIGHTDSGELVVVVKGKGRGRPKGRLNQKREKCAICDKEFSCSGRYMSHVAQHGPVLYQCRQCSETCSTRLEFNKHQADTGHQGQNVIPCEKDSLAASTEKDPLALSPASTQVEVKTPDAGPGGSLPDLNPEPASAAEKGATNVPMETESDKADSTEPPGKGDATDQTAAPEDKGSEEPPETAASPGKVKLSCPHCEKMFSSKQSRSMHIRAAHRGERPYACSVCGAVFAYPRALALHRVKHRARAPAAPGYACDLCGKVLNHPSSVTYHKEAEHSNQKFVCNKCNKSFKHKQLLQRHQLVHTQLRPYQCKLCNASFKTKANLLNHQLLHSGIRQYVCELCKQRFSHKTSLTLHMRWHKGLKPYVCKVCGKAFSQKGNLSEHGRIHTGEKPFQCVHCSARFTTSSQHRLHLKRHAAGNDARAQQTAGAGAGAGAASAGAGSGGGVAAPPPSPPTPHTFSGGVYACGWCGRTCGSRWALSKHARRHTGERPFKCPLCPRAFADCSNLNKHKKHVHKQVSLLAKHAPVSIAPVKIAPAVARAARPARSPEPRTELVVETSTDGVEERVIYVTYDVDDPRSPDYQLIDPEQAAELLERSDVTATELYSETFVAKKEETEPREHMSVTDEQGNPLHFTMQDGTQLAITSVDGHSLQVITEDGQTIPVEINGFSQDEVQISAPAPTQRLAVDKSDEEPNSSITHYFAIV